MISLSTPSAPAAIAASPWMMYHNPLRHSSPNPAPGFLLQKDTKEFIKYNNALELINN
jgi:hypothetical protein